MAFNGQITGNVGRDPELKYFESGQIVANFTVAVRQAKRQGQEPPPRWVKVAVWGKTAQYVGDYVKKGDKVVLFGRVEPPEQFTKRDGTAGLAEVFTAESIEKFNDAGQQQGQGQQALAAAPPAQAPAQPPAQGSPGWQPNPQQGTVAAGWNRAPLDPPDDDGIPF